LKTKCRNLAIFFPSLLAIENLQNQLVFKFLIALSVEILQKNRKTKKLLCIPFLYKSISTENNVM